MAIYHYSQKPVSREKGQSAVASAAYRAADKLYDQRIDQTFDYSRRGGRMPRSCYESELLQNL